MQPVCKRQKSCTNVTLPNRMMQPQCKAKGYFCIKSVSNGAAASYYRQKNCTNARLLKSVMQAIPPQSRWFNFITLKLFQMGYQGHITVIVALVFLLPFLKLLEAQLPTYSS